VGPELDLALAFMAGLLGSGHCLGMCGGLCSAFFMRLSGGAGSRPLGWLPHAAYHGTRIGVYTLVGALAALVGLALTSTGIIGKAQGILQIVAGVIVILLGLDILGVRGFRIPLLQAPVGLVMRVFMRAADKGPTLGAAAGGLVNGFMPCALTLAMAVKATTAPSVGAGALLMLVFGLGTLPSMLLVSVLFSRLGTKARGRLLQLAAIFVIGLGVATLYQGATFFDVMKNLPNW
jgi:hypothetical protein